MSHLMQTMQLCSERLRTGKASAVEGACSMEEQMMDANLVKRGLLIGHFKNQNVHSKDVLP